MVSGHRDRNQLDVTNMNGTDLEQPQSCPATWTGIGSYSNARPMGTHPMALIDDSFIAQDSGVRSPSPKWLSQPNVSGP